MAHKCDSTEVHPVDMNPCRYCSKMCFKVAPRSKAENSVQSSVRLTQIIYWQFRCGGTYLTLKVTYTYRVLVYLLCFYFILKRLWRAIYDQDWLPAAGPGGTVKLETTQSGVLNCYRMTLPESTPYLVTVTWRKGRNPLTYGVSGDTSTSLSWSHEATAQATRKPVPLWEVPSCTWGSSVYSVV